jgi:hypothetical protein
MSSETEEAIEQQVANLVANRKNVIEDFVSTYLCAQDCDDEYLLPLFRKMVLHEKLYQLGGESYTKFWITFDHPNIEEV